MRRAQRYWFIILSLGGLAALLGMWVQYNLHHRTVHQVTWESATVFPEARAIPEFHLTDGDGRALTNQNLKGHISLLFFGFTHCPDLCPTTLRTLKGVYEALQASGVKDLPQVLFISVDPERDTPSVIQQYVHSFNPAFRGATGTPKELEQLTHALSVLYAKVLNKGEGVSGEYTIDHSGTILVVSPEGKFYGIFTLPHEAEKIAQDIQRMGEMSASPTQRD